MPAPSPEARASMLRNFFIGRWDTYTVGKENGHYLVAMDPQRNKLPLTEVDLIAHCNGEITVATYLTDDEAKTPVAVLDIDSKQEPAKQIATFSQGWFSHYNIPSFIEPSGRRGYHVWIIFKSRLPAAKAKRLLVCLMEDWRKSWERWAQDKKEPYPFEVTTAPGVAGTLLLDFEGNEVRLPFLVEINPKQETKTTKDTPGSGVKLPWGMHRVTKKFTAFINSDWQHYPDWGITALASATAVTEEIVDQVLSQHPEEKKGPPPADRKPKTYGLPCYAKMMDGVAEGFRHIASLRLGIQLHRQGLSEERATAMLLNWDQEANSPPLGQREIRSSIKSAYSGKYKLGCADIQAAGFCDKSCPVYSKMYLERDEKVEAESADIIEHIVKVTTRPPTYKVLIMSHWISMSLDDLYKVSLFKKKVMADADFIPHVGMKQKDWEILITQRLAKKELEDAPEDAGEEAEVLDVIYDWLNSSPKAETYNDVLGGRPALRDDYYHFRGKDIKTMLRQKRIAITQSQLWTIIRHGGGFSSTIRMEGKVLRLWRLPERVRDIVSDEGEGEIAPESVSPDIPF